MTKSARGKKETLHEHSGYQFTREAKRVKLQSQKCIAEIHRNTRLGKEPDSVYSQRQGKL